jgi:hypothetical protein
MGNSSDCRECLHEEAGATVEQDKLSQGRLSQAKFTKKATVIARQGGRHKGKKTRLSAFGSESRLICDVQ